MPIIGNNLYDLDTPCLFVDVDVMENNLKRMSKICEENRTNLRPHVKTHKTAEIAGRQLQLGASGITVAKVSEAEVFAGAGFKDIFIAYPIIGEQKIMRLLKISGHCKIKVAVDSYYGAKDLSAYAQKANITLLTMVEVNIGYNRCGVELNKAVQFIKDISKLPNLSVNGIFAFRHLLYPGSKMDSWEEGKEEGRIMAALAGEIKKEGIELSEISVGSTPTAPGAASIEGITEVRPGTYVFNDSMQVALGIANVEDCAARVLCTIVSQPREDIFTIDGGSKTFAGDLTPDVPPLNLKGLGMVKDYPHFKFYSQSEEHGLIKTNGDKKDLQIGRKMEIIPNHICTVVNLFDNMVVCKNNKVVDIWPVIGRGKIL